jgi:predicted nuclease of predicted toxin-antitoxin system
MRLLANENIAARIVAELRQRGHDVLAAKEAMRGEPDVALLQRASTEGRVLVTQDKDFGELAFRAGLPAESGIILFRLSSTSAEIERRRIIQAIEDRADWTGHFAVVTDDRIRIRALPKRP